MTQLTVLGAGYVGAVAAACLAELGHRVTCVEQDRERLEAWRTGRIPLHEDGLADLVTKGLRSGALTFAPPAPEASASARFLFVAVQTPAEADGFPNTTFVDAAVESALPHLPQGAVVVLKSTVPVGAGDALAVRCAASGRPDVAVVNNPEFLRQGTAVRDFLRPHRIVIGSADPAAAEAVAALYEGIEAPVVLTSRRSAEMAKYVANAYLATRVSFVNEVAEICESAGADIQDVAEIVGLDPRIGLGYFNAGLGWGGSCLPKDVAALSAIASRAGLPHGVLSAVAERNRRQRERAAQLLLDAARAEDGGKVAVLGAAFKPGTDDLRESPALGVVEELLAAGIAVCVFDPVVPARRLAGLGVAVAGSPQEALRGADAVLLATEWPELAGIDWREARQLMRGSLVLDGRNALEPAEVTAAGLRYVGFGTPAVEGAQ